MRENLQEEIQRQKEDVDSKITEVEQYQTTSFKEQQLVIEKIKLEHEHEKNAKEKELKDL